MLLCVRFFFFFLWNIYYYVPNISFQFLLPFLYSCVRSIEHIHLNLLTSRKRNKQKIVIQYYSWKGYAFGELNIATISIIRFESVFHFIFTIWREKSETGMRDNCKCEQTTQEKRKKEKKWNKKNEQKKNMWKANYFLEFIPRHTTYDDTEEPEKKKKTTNQRTEKREKKLQKLPLGQWTCDDRIDIIFVLVYFDIQL